MESHEMNELNYAKCDLCKESKHTALLHHNGTPVLAVCHDCDPKNYEQVKHSVLARLNGYLNALAAQEV